ncbi:MAG: peptidase M23 [Desulfovibrionales bacterium]|nr:MAG: peptidase M23 [Desulfovibrionales bacterium]
MTNHQATSMLPAVRHFRGFRIFCGALMLLFLCAGPRGLNAETPETVQRAIEQRQRDMRAHEKILKGLTDQERRLFANLQDVETRLRSTAEEVENLESRLEHLRREEQARLQDYQELELAQSRTSEELARLLTVLWPVHLQGVEHYLETLNTWDEADRQFHWLSRIYELVQDRIAQLREQERELARGQVLLEQAREEISRQMVRVNAGKDRLLQQKLDFLRGVQEVRAQQVSAEEHIQEIMQSITELNYQLQAMTTRTFSNFRGGMSWPAQGRLVESYRPQASPPHRGLSMALSESAPVRAISWGKVVHSDVLRGYGHVVILYHGEDYYSLYAFLSTATVAVGQEVEKSEQLGIAGFYPKVDGPGLYFELRFQQNPVNPGHWLVAQ